MEGSRIGKRGRGARRVERGQVEGVLGGQGEREGWTGLVEGREES